MATNDNILSSDDITIMLNGRLLPRINTIGALGDSITSANVITTITTDDTYSGRGDFVWAKALSGDAFEFADFGVSGETIPQIRARLPAALALGYSAYSFAGGTNDGALSGGVAVGNQNTPGTSIGDTYLSVMDIINSGALCILATYPPNGLMIGNTADAVNRRNHHNRYNAWVRKFAAQTQGILLYDRDKVCADVSSFGMRANFSVGDDIHPATLMGCALGWELYENVLQPFLGFGSNVGGYAFDHLNYSQNPFMAGDNASGSAGWSAGTGITGNGPDGIGSGRRNTGSAVASKVARPDRLAGTLAQLAITSSADHDGAGFSLGSDDVAATGRYDQGWVANTAHVRGIRRKPTVANGYIYLLTTAGTTGSIEPTWPTTEGATVADGTCVWMCLKMPAQGDVFFGIAEVFITNVTAGKWAHVDLNLYAIDIAGASMGAAYGLLGERTGSLKSGIWFPTTKPLIIRTRDVTLGAGTLRHLALKVLGMAESGATFNMAVGRHGIFRKVP